jgi:hypothetical protein
VTKTTTATPVSQTMALAIVDEALQKDYDSGVIGVRGTPDRALEADMQHRGQTVRIRPAESALAVREVLTERPDDGWLVVVTDRDDHDLGAGILSHFVWQRLRSPDPWEAVRHRFSASGIDPALMQVAESRELAAGLLAAAPPSGWPAAPAGVLTRRHALAAVAADHLDLERDGIDGLAVLRWTLRPGSAAAVATLRDVAGNRLTDEVLEWIAQQSGSAYEAVSALLRQGEIADAAPIGVVSSLLTSGDLGDPDLAHQGQLALVRLESRWGSARPSLRAQQSLGTTARALLADLVHDRRWADAVERSLQRADDIIAQCQAEGLSVQSDLLPRGLTARLRLLADSLRKAPSADMTSPTSAEIEAAWERVQLHLLSETSSRQLAPFHAAVRLCRWLGGAQDGDAADLVNLTRRHLSEGAWVDAAVNDVLMGVDDDSAADGLAAVAEAAREQRRAEERRFATALATATAQESVSTRLEADTTGAPIWAIEALLPEVVVPMARTAPVLFLVMDGMSAATATEIIDDAVTHHGWFEAALPGMTSDARGGAIAVLPSLTKVSRASMLCGRLTTGEQAVELKGHAELTNSAGKIRGSLFHKKEVDTRAPGWAISDEVGRAINDPETRLVSVVLNTIDDALDRSDPAGTTWTADAVKHLAPLLARARAAGRTVVMTADHGHVVERRGGTQRSYPDSDGGRVRAASGPIGEGEIEVSGPRVLTTGHRAVLAVDEDLRYGPLKAGYHGGGSAAEVVVPVVALVSDPDTNPHELRLLPPQAPIWWFTAQGTAVGVETSSPAIAPPHFAVPSLPATRDAAPSLFDDVEAYAEPESPSSGDSLGGKVTASAPYAAQRSVTGRLIVTDGQVADLIDSLVAGSGRVTDVLAARAMGLNPIRLRGALAQVQQLLNVDGYAVLGADVATRSVVLDVPLLKEQFEIR